MALVVEDGTGIATAESYATVAAADARHAALGNTAWTGGDAIKEQALRRATQHMVQAYRTRWRGTRLLRAQALDWPRYGVTADGYDVPSTEVPAEVVAACCDLALRALAGDLNPDLTADTSRVVIREKVGPLETEYAQPAISAPQSPRYVSVDAMLAPYLIGGGAMARLVRA